MVERSACTATAEVGRFGGWVVGDGPPVLLLHGRPRLGYDYMEPLIAEFAPPTAVLGSLSNGGDPLNNSRRTRLVSRPPRPVS